MATTPGVFTNGILGSVDKRCNRCERMLPISEFFLDSRQMDGLGAECGTCRSARSRATIQRQRAAAIEHLGGCCRECGYSEDARGLAIDHVNGGGGEARRSGLNVSRLLQAAVTDTEGHLQLL